MTLLNEKCAVCGGRLIEKEVEKLLRGGRHMAAMKVKAEVCLHCGERFFKPDDIEWFERVEFKLEHDQTNEFKVLGAAFQVVSSSDGLTVS